MHAYRKCLLLANCMSYSTAPASEGEECVYQYSIVFLWLRNEHMGPRAREQVQGTSGLERFYPRDVVYRNQYIFGLPAEILGSHKRI